MAAATELTDIEPQTQESPMSTAGELPAAYEDENALTPRVDCVDYSDASECGRYTCCGLPLVDGFSKHTMLSQHDPIQVAMWDSITGSKALCWVADPYRYTSETALQLLKDALTEILPINSRFRLSSPIPSTLTKRARPVAFLIWNIGKDEVTLLAAREVWSVRTPRDLAFFVENYEGPPSPFVFTATGFKNRNMFGHNEIEALFRESVRWHPTVVEFVTRFHDTLPDASHASPDYLLSCCRVELLLVKDCNTGEDVDFWNISMESPTELPGLHAAWRNLIASIPLISLAYGSARVIDEALLCAICLATSHQAYYCPWPKLRDWAGPVHGSSTTKMELPDERAKRGIAGSGEPLLCDAEVTV